MLADIEIILFISNRFLKIDEKKVREFEGNHTRKEVTQTNLFGIVIFLIVALTVITLVFTLFIIAHHLIKGWGFPNLHVILNEINKGYKNRFLIKVCVHYKSIQDNEIACFYILERATFIRTLSDNDYSIDYSLDNLQKTIDPDKFFRINRNCIVNINEISDILIYSSSRLKVKLKSNKPIYDFIISKDKVREFKKRIDK